MQKHIAIARWVSVLALGLFASASAQQSGLQSYDVELVIFRTLSSQATAEDWRMESGGGDALVVPEDDSGDTEQAIAPPQSAPMMTFPALPQAKYKLTALSDTLRRSRNYQSLAHFGWTQPGFPRGEARYMSVDGLLPANTGVTGRIALSRGRYLHLTLELTYESPESPGERLVMKQTRRMRSNERHYIDHPKFGVIAVITPTAG